LISGLFIGASPAWLHNYFVAHEPVMLSAHSGINFWIGNNPDATGYPKMPAGIRASQDGLLKDSVTLAERAAGRKLKRVEVSNYWTARANDYIHANRAAWFRLMGLKLANFWNAYQYDDLSIIKLLVDDEIVPPGLRFGVVAALGLASLMPVIWIFPRARWIAAAVFLHMLALMPVFITERYRMAAVPGLLLLGSGGVWLLWNALASNRWATAAGISLTVVGAAWFVSTPRSDASLWALDFYKAGIRSEAAGDCTKALLNLETAFAYVPDNADVNFALGNHWLAEGDRDRAKLFYRRSLELVPTHEGTLNNLGVMAIEEKRWSLAETFLLGSLTSEPNAAKTHYLLARVRFESGNYEGANAALDKALELKPKQKEFLELRANRSGAQAPGPLEP
jgi:tetratricopeptide (TPR) repeat protein